MSGPRMDLLGADLFARGRVAQWRLKWAVQGSWKQMQKTLSPPSQVSRVRMAQNVKKCRFLHGRFLHRLQVWVWSCNMFSEIAEGVNLSLGPWWIKRCHFIKKKTFLEGIPGGTSGKESACQYRRCKRPGFHPWVRKIPWRRAWQPTPVFLPGESQGQRSLQGYSP